MNNYVRELSLNYDPFEPKLSKKSFFGGGNRQELCNQIVERAMYSESLIVVCGCLGSGKTMLASVIAESFADEAVCTMTTATLFMNSEQFLESMLAQLDLHHSGESKEDSINSILQLTNQLDLEAKSLLIQVDDAHELSNDVLQDLLTIKENAPPSSVHVILFGESQLGHMLDTTLEASQKEGVAEFDLGGFSSEATIAYIQFKLESAGYSSGIPLTGSEIGAIYNGSNGIPGTINALTADALNENSQGPIKAEIAASAEGLEDAAEPQANDEFEEGVYSNTRKYMYAAAALTIVFLGTLVFYDPQPTTELSRVELPVSVTSNTAEIQPPLETAEALLPESDQSTDRDFSAQPIAINEEPAATLLVAADAEEEILPLNDGVESVEELSEQTPDIVTVETEIIPEVDESVEQVASSSVEITAPYTDYEQTLLSKPSNHFVVQVVAASSESNIQNFVSNESLGDSAGYFETSLNSKPWFVVVLGTYASRSSAQTAIDGLPSSMKAHGPWIRGLAGIQADIQSAAIPR